jgi:uroporphyrinogen-III decarboxylase
MNGATNGIRKKHTPAKGVTMAQLTSRERLLRALNLETPDHVPCCFMSFSALRKRYAGDRYKVVKAQQAMGLDAMLFIPSAPRRDRPEHPDLRGLPVRHSPHVKTREWYEKGRLHKAYVTPDGTLTTSVLPSGDWPHGDRIPFVDDYQIPRKNNPLINGPDDLDALRHLLVAPEVKDVVQFDQEVQKARAFVQNRGVLLAGGWGVGMDMANWLCGIQELMILTMQHPDFVDDLLEMIHVWNRQRMAVVLSAPVDLYIRRAWYEGCDFVTPTFFRKAILPRLKVEVDLTHERGAMFGYICSSGIDPMLDLYLEAGIDVLIGVDPVQGTRTDMAAIKRKLSDRICVWGGVSGAVTVEMGAEEDVRAAVRRAINILGPSGMILSPVDNITIDAPRTWENIDILIDEWQRHW